MSVINCASSQFYPQLSFPFGRRHTNPTLYGTEAARLPPPEIFSFSNIFSFSKRFSFSIIFSFSMIFSFSQIFWFSKIFLFAKIFSTRDFQDISHSMHFRFQRNILFQRCFQQQIIERRSLPIEKYQNSESTKKVILEIDQH